MDLIFARANYWAYLTLLMMGLYFLMSKRNLVKKIIGLGIVQSSVILFFLTLGYKWGASVPILEHGHYDPAAYVNPLPHVLMLTAIVVGVSTLGVALSLVVMIYRRYGTLEEDVLLERLEE